jgi:hypothetical protein
MTERHDGVSDSPDDTIEEALTDHHLDEVAEMIEQAEADAWPSESPLSDSPADPLTRS